MRKGNLKMTENENTTCQCTDDSLTFEDLLTELRAVDNKDRTKNFIDAINNYLKELLQAVCKYSEKGSMTIKLNFGIDKKSKELKNKIDISIKKPKGTCTNMLYHNDKGDILLYNPDMTSSAEKVTRLR